MSDNKKKVVYALDERRSKQVNKKRELVQKSRFTFSLFEQKTIIYVISKLNPMVEQDSVIFDIKDFAEITGIERGSNLYSEVRKSLKKIRDTSVYIELPNGKETTMSFWTKVHLDGKAGMVKLDLDPDIKPYLFDLREGYTHYEMIWVLPFKSKYSIRLYEFLRSYHYHELESYTVSFDVEELKKHLDAENYKTWQHFKDRVLMPALQEINEYSDKRISHEVLKEGRSVVGIRFHIEHVIDVLERKRREERITNELDMNQYRFREVEE